jgi:hypothetical protein
MNPSATAAAIKNAILASAEHADQLAERKNGRRGVSEHRLLARRRTASDRRPTRPSSARRRFRTVRSTSRGPTTRTTKTASSSSAVRAPVVRVSARLCRWVSMRRPIAIPASAPARCMVTACARSKRACIPATPDRLRRRRGPPPSTLSVSGSAVKSGRVANLTWSPSGSTNVDVYRNNVKIVTTANDGSHAESLGMSSSTFKQSLYGGDEQLLE